MLRYCVCPIFVRNSIILSNVALRRIFNQPNDDEGFTRSIYCKPAFKEVTRNGEVVKIPTGLVDTSVEPFGDQFVTFQMKLTYKHDLDMNAVIAWAQKRIKEKNRRRQIVSSDAIQHLGMDLAVAHMICKIGGRVQFAGNPKWFQQYVGFPAELPRSYVGDLKLEAIDLSGTNVVYEGFEMIPELSNLRYLRLKRCVHVDDFCLSRVGRSQNLQLLDVSECPRLTVKGLATLAQLKSLRRLIVHGNPLMEDRELACLMLEDHLPKLYVDGVDYLGQLSAESQQNVVALIAASSEDRDKEDGSIEEEEEAIPAQRSTL